VWWLLVRRTVQAMVTLFITVTVVFIVARLTGNPADVMLPQTSTPAQRQEIVEAYGFDKPVFSQYVTYISSLLHGDLGESLRYRVPVTDVIWTRLLNSMQLGIVAMLLSAVIGIPLGVLSAVRRRSWMDKLSAYIAIVGQSVPPFVMGILLILLFGVILKWLPPSGMDSLSSFVLPSVTISAFLIAGVVRLVRSSMLEVLDMDYITLARSKGVSEATVIWRHAVPNAVLPVVTFVGLMLGVIVTGGVTVEVIFAWPGLGQLVYSSILSRDFPITQAAITLGAAMVILINLLVDVLYLFLDPRTRR
jgi:ABC-type dipeptide/oligopeptide/nickel transport system permease component